MKRPLGPFTVDGQPLRLGRRIGRGGEGEVFGVAKDPARAVKLYDRAGAAAREAKVAAMLRAGLADRAPLVAFPQAAVHDRDGRFAGFTMQRIDGAEPLHELYVPGARKRLFPEADYRFIVRAAVNAARAVASAHRAGCVIGDVNHSGFLIGADALVALIDADSFQIEADGERYLCRVGVPEYTPPELIGQSLSTVVRTAEHDAFGLAVLLFQLLFLGRHPFAGVGPDMAVAEAIAQGAFAYSARETPLTPPPGALRLDEVPPVVAALFERAFAPGKGRPAAAEWVAGLEAFEAALGPCPANPRHFHAAAACPWCRIEKRGRTALFPAPGEPGSAPAALDRAEALRRIEAIQLPESFAYVPPVPLPTSAPPEPTPRAKALDGLGTLGVAFMMACAVGLVVQVPQSFLMCAPILIYGVGPVGDALLPRRAARRKIGKLDREYVSAVQSIQSRADLDAAALLRAELSARAAKLPGASARRTTPRQRADAASVARDLPRLEAMAEGMAALLASRDAALDRALAKRQKLAEALTGWGEDVPPLPEVAPRTLREATRAAMARVGAKG